MSESNDESTSDRLRDALGRTAADLTLDPAAPASFMQRASSRRRRRRVLLAGAAAAVGVAVIGAVVANRNLGDDTIELATPETTEPAETSGDSSDVASTTPEATTPPTTVPITTPPTLPAERDAPASATGVSVGGPDQVLPWRDGFLSIGFSFPPQPLTPLSDDLAALFPDEITALFPDGLPPTIDEAIDVLSEAGLLDEVSEIISEHPELSEAIYATPPSPPTANAAYTVDGNEWEVSELELPTGYPGQFTVADDRLITWSIDPLEPLPAGDVRPAERQLIIAATTDLTTWETTAIDLTTDADDARADYLRSEVYVNSLAVNGDRWIAQVNRHTWVDHEAMLPDDVRADLWASEHGYGITPSTEGIEVEVFGDDGSSETASSFTWAELGVDGDPDIGLTRIEAERPTMLVGTFGGGHEELPTPAGIGFSTFATLGDQFVQLGDTVQTSADGRSWDPVDGLPRDGFWQTVTPVSGGHLFVGDGADGAFAWMRFDDGTLTEVTLPELPERYGLWNSSGSAAWITEVGMPPDVAWEPIEIVVEHDGFVLTLLDGPDGSTHTLTDAATGEVILTRTIGRDDIGPEIWEYDEETDRAWIVIRHDDGTEIVRIPGEVLDEAFQAAAEANEPDRTVAVETELDDWRPDFWLIATADGVNWLTVDLDDPGPESDFWPNAAAVNDGSVLYLTDGGWTLRQLPG